MPLKRTILGLAATIVLLVTALVPAIGTRAQDSIGIAAVVNDDAISVFDVFERMRIVMITANLEDTPETRQRLVPQVLRALIDERLQRQEGDRLGVQLSDAEMKAATEFIEDSIGLPRGQLDAFLNYNNIDKDAFLDQIRTELVWNKLVEERMREETITDEEIDETLKRLKASENETMYLLAEIFVSVDDPSRESEAMANMERLAESLRGGASFPALARQFSQSASSAAGGDLGWIPESQLPADLRATVAAMAPGTISPPLHVAGGLKLLLLRDRRVGFGSSEEVEEVVLRQALLPVNAGDDEAAIADESAIISESVKTCDDFDKIAESMPEAQVSAPVTAKLNELQPALVEVVSGLDINQSSEPLRSEMGYHVVMVCERTMLNAGLPTREQILKQLKDQQFDLVARGYLRDLRRTAFVDVRM